MNHLNLHDRINVIGAPTVKDICSRVRDMGIPAIALGQHEDGGYFEPKFIDPVKEVLTHCRSIGLKVIMRIHDVSKCHYGNPAGWPLRDFLPHRPRRFNWTKIDDQRWQLRVLLQDSQVYRMDYQSEQPCELFLFKDGHQLARLHQGTGGTVEFVSHYGKGYYEILFRFPSPIPQPPFPATVSRLESVESEDLNLGRYVGKKGLSGHYLARTGDLSNQSERVTNLANTVGEIAIHYAEFHDIIDGTIADLDEFQACGGVYDSKDLVSYIRDLALLSSVIWRGPLYGWMRPGDWAEHAGHCNYPEKDRPDHFARAMDIQAFWPIAWEEKTTVELCRADYVATNGGVAGIYLTESTPQHFKAAGFTQFSAFWWPKTGQTYGQDFPYTELELCARLFG